MQDAGNENASRLTSKKDDVLTLFHAAQAGANVIGGAVRCRVGGQPPATRFKFVNVLLLAVASCWAEAVPVYSSA